MTVPESLLNPQKSANCLCNIKAGQLPFHPAIHVIDEMFSSRFDWTNGHENVRKTMMLQQDDKASHGIQAGAKKHIKF